MLLQGYTDSPSIFIPLNNEIPFDKQIKLRGFFCNKHPAAALLLSILHVKASLEHPRNTTSISGQLMPFKSLYVPFAELLFVGQRKG